MKSILAVSIALLATSAQAGLRWFSKCPTVSSIAYDNAMGSAANHKLLYLDSTADSAMKTVRSMITAIPNLQCFDLASITGQPFGFDSTTYNNLFVSETVAYYSKVLYFDAFTKTHVNYMCIDAVRVDMIIDWAFTQFNVKFPTWVAKIFSKVFYLFSIDGVAIFSSQNSIASSVETNIASAVKTKLGAFDITKDIVKYVC
jgi:hypothetical protein